MALPSNFERAAAAAEVPRMEVREKMPPLFAAVSGILWGTSPQEDTWLPPIPDLALHGLAELTTQDALDHCVSQDFGVQILSESTCDSTSVSVPCSVGSCFAAASSSGLVAVQVDADRHDDAPTPPGAPCQETTRCPVTTDPASGDQVSVLLRRELSPQSSALRLQPSSGPSRTVTLTPPKLSPRLRDSGRRDENVSLNVAAGRGAELGWLAPIKRKLAEDSYRGRELAAVGIGRKATRARLFGSQVSCPRAEMRHAEIGRQLTMQEACARGRGMIVVPDNDSLS